MPSKPVRLRVLVADDNRDTTEVLAAILRDEGHDVHIALRGDEVSEIDRLIRPDALILDINMPGMSGYAVAREIRERRGPLAPLLIAISGAWKERAEQRLAQDLGFDYYLRKPCEPAELVALLNAFRSRGRSEASGGK
ncbi:MAG TPA: response regulator [Burkholderiales bacterium]|jgi:DNA-binding response OmpR family regulator|nr:response regulator [Burkholderiales bacterium]